MSEETEENLREVYNKVYEEGKEVFHSHLPLDLIYSEVYKMIQNHVNKKRVLDLGSGDGDFLIKYMSLEEPLEIVGYDFSEIGIKNSQENEIAKERKMYFRQVSFEDLKFEIEEDSSLDKDYFDVITSIGVIEHLDNPEILFYLANKFLKSGGCFVLEHPNFLNIRGIIWKALEIFINAEMSKTDKHMILPDKIFEYMNYYDFECELVKTFDHDRGMYSNMIEDFSKRLKLAMEGKVDNLDNKIKEFFTYLKFVTNEKVFPISPANGAEVAWKFWKK